MERLAAGHDAALNDLMERHATPLFHFLCRMVGNEDDAGDLAQETFVRVFRARASFRPGEKFSTWLFTIAANLARNHFRWRSRHPNVFARSRNRRNGSNPCSTLAGERARAKRTGAGHRTRRNGADGGRQIAGDLREAIVLCEWEELSVAEAAAILESTPKAVESRLYRARQMLRERLKSWL